MTRLTAEQWALVARELEAMRAAGEQDEVWRISKMFADGRFDVPRADLPESLRGPFADPGPPRRRSYRLLLEKIRAAAPAVFDVAAIGAEGDYELVKMVSRPPPSPYAARLSIGVVAGMHGDELDGILGPLEFARRFASSPDLVGTYSLTIYPCVNPSGYELLTRESAGGKDLNREFMRNSREEEVLAMERELSRHEFLGLIGAHSDYESFGLYAYATGAVISERLAKPALFQASSVIPINTDPVIDGHPARFGIIGEKYPGSLGPLTRGATEPFDITIETPNLVALRKRVEAHAIALETILHEYRAVSAEGMYL